MLKRKIKNSQKGFTLLELLVVISIIGVLVTIGLATITSARLKSRDSKRKTDLKSVSDALQFYYDENGEYPSSVSGFSALASTLKASGVLDKSNIADPLNKGAYVYKYGSANDDQGATLSFCLTAVLENSAKDKSDEEDGGPNNTVYEVWAGKEGTAACGNARP